MLSGYTTQANMLLLEGALPHQVDQALESFGMSMGPFRMLDLVGLDLGWRARKLSDRDAPLAAKIMMSFVNKENLAKKWQRIPIIIMKAPEHQFLPLKMKKYIEKFHLITELKEERYLMLKLLIDVYCHWLMKELKFFQRVVAQRAVDMDVVYINGYGFPIWRGGPMHHANTLGLQEVVKRLNKYKDLTGDTSFTPTKLLSKLSEEDSKLGNAPDGNEREESLALKAHQ